jgi:O-6-methylguanine DNA methyltransferase
MKAANMAAKQAAAEFAAATDALVRGESQARLGGFEPSFEHSFEPSGELLVATRLRASAPQGIPDPLFVDGLRRELLLRLSEKQLPEAAAVSYATISTPIGELAVAFREGRVICCNRFETGEAFEREVARTVGARATRLPSLPVSINRGVLAHIEGRRRFAAIDISWLPAFQRRVLEKTSEIPRGEVRPYGWIAREIGSPGASRAVGTALGHNPIPFIIPCHRVVRSDGSLGEYSGGGPAMKVRVLEYEGVPAGDLLVRGNERYRGSSTTKTVCYPSCHAAQRIRPENRARFTSLAAAAKAGYRPCKLCRPA